MKATTIGRSPMRRCGRQYATEDEAYRSRRGQRDGAVAHPCPCGGWHIASQRRVSTGFRTAARKAAKPSRDTIPPAVRKLVAARDPWCLWCGTTDGLEEHHRRLKGIGGDPRPHTDCPCNLIRLCARDHHRAHVLERLAAEGLGYILPGETRFPGSEGVMIHTGLGGGVTRWPGCDGRWADEPEGSVAAHDM